LTCTTSGGYGLGNNPARPSSASISNAAAVNTRFIAAVCSALGVLIFKILASSDAVA
jgi:hypothetical protein